MFLSYVLCVDDDDSYTIRCIESLYQTNDDDFEVIVAQYHEGMLQARIMEYVARYDNLHIVTDEKNPMREAASLISKDAQFVQFLRSNRMATPYSRSILREQSHVADLIVPLVILQKKDSFVERRISDCSFSPDDESLSVFDFCIRKSLVDRYVTELTEDPDHTELFLDFLMALQKNFATTEEPCYYLAVGRSVDPLEQLDFDRLRLIAENVVTDPVTGASMKLYLKYVERMLRVVHSPLMEESVQEQAYEILALLGHSAMNQPVLQTIFRLNVGYRVEELTSMSYSGYRIATQVVSSYTHNTYAVLEKRLLEVAKRLETAENANTKAITQLKHDVAGISTNLHSMQGTLAKGIKVSEIATAKTTQSQAPMFQNPVQEVPYLFATGRLGLKTVWRSFCGWLRYKLHRK